MRIAIILDSLHSGGAEILAVRLARRLLEQGHSLFFLALRDEGEMGRQIEAMGAGFHAINTKRGVRLSTMFKMYQQLQQVQPDIVLTNHFRPLLHTWFATQLLCVPLYHVEHDNLHYRTKKHYLKILRFLLGGMKKMVVISPSLYSYFTDKIPSAKNKLVTIANGVDTSHFSSNGEMRQKSEFAGEKVIFGTCARLVPIKNIELMLDVFHAYRQKFQCGHIILVGDGVCREQLEKKTAECNLQEHVTFAGYQEDCAPWYQLMDYYLLTSDDEGLPLSVLEAMACGVVVVSRNVGDMDRLLQHGGGRVVYGADTNLWLNSLEEVDSNKELYSQLSQQAQDIVQEQYSFDSCVAQYVQLFEEK